MVVAISAVITDCIYLGRYVNRLACKLVVDGGLNQGTNTDRNRPLDCVEDLRALVTPCRCLRGGEVRKGTRRVCLHANL